MTQAEHPQTVEGRPTFRIVGRCSCQGTVRLMDKTRRILDMRVDQREAGEWFGAFVGAHSDHYGMRFEATR